MSAARGRKFPDPEPSVVESVLHYAAQEDHAALAVQLDGLTNEALVRLMQHVSEHAMNRGLIREMRVELTGELPD